jgi:pyruvate dehydrogenase E1 component alpha subunit
MHLFSEEHNLLGGFAFIGEGIPVALGGGLPKPNTAVRLWAKSDADQVTAQLSLAMAPPITVNSLNV